MTDKPKKRGGFLRLLLWMAGAFLLLLLAAALIVPRLIDWEKVRLQAEAKISETLHHRVTIGSVGFHLLRGIEIGKVRVANAAGFSSQPLLSADAAVVHYRLLPLLWGQVMLKAVVFQRPVLRIERSARGVFNFSDMLSAPAASAPQAAPEKKSRAALPLQLLVSRLAVEHGDFSFHDLGAGSRYALSDLNLEVKNLSLAGLTPVKVLLSTQIKTQGQSLPVKVSADWRFSLARDLFTLDRLEASLPGCKLTAHGSLERVRTDRILDFAGTVESDLNELLTALRPLAGNKLPKDVKLTGSAKLTWKAKGPAGDLAALAASLEEDVSAQAEAEGLSVPLTLTGRVALAQAALAWSQTLSVPGCKAELTGKLNDVAKTRTLAAKFTASLDLAEATAKLMPPEAAKKLAAVQGSGRVQAQAEINGPLSDLKRLNLSARCLAQDAFLRYQQKTILENLNATLTVVPDRVSLPDLTCKLAGQPVRASFSAQGFDLRNPASLKPDSLRAKVDWSLSSPLLDVDALLALVPTKPGTEKAAAAPATVSDLPEPDARQLMPAGLVLQGKADLGGIKFGTVKLGKLSAQTVVKQRQLNLTAALAGYHGNIQAKTRLDFSHSLLGYAVDAETKNVDVEPLLNDIEDTFLAAKLKKPALIAELKDKLTGSLSGHLHVAGAGMRTANAKPRLTGQGSFTLANGRLRKFAFQENLAKLFGSDRFNQDLPFDHTVAEFTLANQEVNLTKFLAESGAQGDAGDMRLSANGRLTFKADFKDFRLRPSLSPRASSSLSSEFRNYTEVLKDERGWVTIPTILNGPMTKPQVVPDWDWIKQQFAGYGQKKLKAAGDEAKKKAQNYLEQQKGKSPDQVKQDLGEQVEKAKEGLKNLNLNNLFH